MGSVGSWVRLRETVARKRHGSIPSICEFGFGEPRHEGGTEGFRRFVSLASGNRGMKEARKGSVDLWVRLRETEARMRHRRVPLVREIGFGKPRHEGDTKGFRRFMSLA
ncbi:hypothetical protein RHGRI_014358 [Rhododendron griersonianum]|uniref:Uncharacterized protein n=1 Tax=Rhododendron griersonianum TaxID=479676 RepID=A0AAV6K927_9ERIC|nr:hypothetical protein RHGRI_014358 [Rhododendron griersonianum]